MGLLSTEGHCLSYCSHGGVCTLDDGHGGKHDSNYCQWTDEEALSYEAAQNVLASRGEQGFLVAMDWDLMIGGPDDASDTNPS